MSLFEHLVGTRELQGRDGETQCLRCYQIYDELELGRLIDRKISGLRPAQRYAGLRALVSIVMPGSMTSVPSTLKPTLFRAPSVYSDVRHTAFGLSTTLWRRYQAAKGARSRAGPVYPRKQASGLTSAMAGRVSAQTGGRGSELDAQTSN